MIMWPSSYHNARVHSAWDANSAGGHTGAAWGRNPQLSFTVSRKTLYGEIVITQEDRALSGGGYMSIGFTIWKARASGKPLDKQYKSCWTEFATTWTNRRNVCVHPCVCCGADSCCAAGVAASSTQGTASRKLHNCAEHA